MKIKTVCEKTGLTDRTIRYYIEEGLISPSYTENYLGRKSFEFSDENISELNDIAVLRSFDFSIEEIRVILLTPESSPDIIKGAKERLEKNLLINEKKVSAMSLLNAEQSYTLSQLAMELSKPDELEVFNFERYERYKLIEENEVMYEEYMMEDAEICLVAFGVAARVSQNAIDQARARGIKVGMIRPITVWPFPKKPVLAAADKVKAFISVELNMGQMIEDIELATKCKKPVLLANRTGGMIPTVENILDKITEADKIGG